MELTKKEEDLIRAFRLIHEPPENILMFYKSGRFTGHDKLRELKDNEFAQMQIERDIKDIEFLQAYTKDSFGRW